VSFDYESLAIARLSKTYFQHAWIRVQLPAVTFRSRDYVYGFFLPFLPVFHQGTIFETFCNC
jgi:hypothetical protein